MDIEVKHHRVLLQKIARRAMLERGLLPYFSPEVNHELDQIRSPAGRRGPADHDLCSLLWSSIDNDDSMDLDQLTVAEDLGAGRVKIQVAIADVDALVRERTAIDEHAGHNTTSVYTAAEIFPMLPEKLSTDLTSLSLDGERLAMVVEMAVNPDGSIGASEIYHAWVRNQAKLAYNAVGAWLEGRSAAPEAVTAVPGLAENLRLQDAAAQKLKNYRHVHGALSLETIETRPIFEGNEIRGLEAEQKNRARELIEDFMIAANGVTARYLSAKKYPSIRRVVRVPKRWDRIVELAEQHGAKLPATPDSRALEEFLVDQKAADPLHFPDLSLAVIKLLGQGEYVAEQPDGEAPGHFGLAVRDYAHSTAPNRRYTDLITQRLLKAALSGSPSPYSFNQLAELAEHCTREEDVVNKVERQVNKSAAALLLESRVGAQFDALVTGAAPKGTWVRLINPPVEGKLVSGYEGVDVGDRLRVRLVSVDVEQGFIDFKRVH